MKNIITKTMLSLTPFLAYASYATTEAVQIEQPLKTPFVEYHNRMVVFNITHQAYERIKPDALYAGVETWYIPTFGKSQQGIGEFEFRMGYNFFYNGRDHFTPIGGVGVFKGFHSKHHHGDWVAANEGLVDTTSVYSTSAVVYATAGFLYDHEFNSIFNLGLNVKGIAGGSEKGDDDKKNWGSSVFGLDVSTPITFRFGRDRHWDYRIEPFNLYLHGSEAHANYFGLRSTLGYRF